MKCEVCGKPAIKCKITETRGGAGTIKTKRYACKVHAGFGHSPDIGLGVIRYQEYGPVNPTGKDPS
jgi:hypothetical protein